MQVTGSSSQLSERLVNTAKPIRIPAYMVELLFKWRRMASDMQESLGRPATVEEIAKALKLPKKKLAIVKKAIKVYNLVPQTDQPENGWSLGEMLMDERSRTPDVMMVEADNLRLVLDRLDEMDKREATVLRMRFGLNDAPPRRSRKLASRWGSPANGYARSRTRHSASSPPRCRPTESIANR